MENAIWSFGGHGTAGVIQFGFRAGPETQLSDGDILRLPDGSLSGIKVALVMACHSAPEFIKALVTKGARSAVGFEAPFPFWSGAHWNGGFGELLTKKGYTVSEAAYRSRVSRSSAIGTQFIY